MSKINEFLFRKVDQTKYTDQMPTYPGFTLASHVAMKGLQIGSLLGFGFAPFVSLFQRKSLSSSYSKLMTNGPILGVIASTSMLAYKSYFTSDLTPEGVDDRAFRIKNNHKQEDIDKYSVFGASMGTALNAIVFKGGLFFPCISAGVLCGMGAFMIDQKKLLEELKKLQNEIPIQKVSDMFPFGTDAK